MVNRTLAGVTDLDGAAQADHRRLAALWAAVAAAVALHNTEESLRDMTGWIVRHPWIPGRALHGDQAEFTLVLAIVAVAVLSIAIVAIAARPRWSAEVLVCVAYALMINGASHILLSLVAGSLMPGVISGTAVLLPLGVLIARTLPPVRWTVSTTVVTAVAAVGVTAGAFALAALLTGFG